MAPKASGRLTAAEMMKKKVSLQFSAIVQLRSYCMHLSVDKEREANHIVHIFSQDVEAHLWFF